MSSPNTPSRRPVSRPATWWRRLCPLPGGRIVLSGDLPDDPIARAVHLAKWVDAGITHIIDVRGEWNDEEAVHVLQPQLVYHWLGTHDAGHDQPDEWFDAGVDAAIEALRDPDARVLVHCHMGVNRGPSMGFAILLATGWEPAAAIEAIRTARPIAATIYAEDALEWWHRRSGVEASVAAAQVQELAEWLATHPIDVGWIINRIYDPIAA